MKKKFDDAKKKYQSIEIPEELNILVNNTINKVEEDKNKQKPKRWFTRSIVGIAAVFAIFIIGLNSNQAFAESVSDIPIVGEVAKIFTFKEYKVSNDLVNENISIPSVEGIEDTTLEEKINTEIKKIVEERIKEAEERAAEYKEAYLETGGTEEDYRPIEITVDYELKCSNEDTLSFIVFQYESLASAYAETYYYNIDLKNNKTIELEDVLGNNYVNIINDSVTIQIEELKENPQMSFFEGDSGFNGIAVDQNFYINEDSKVVVVFDKYEIAPGYMGEVEFVIE